MDNAQALLWNGQGLPGSLVIFTSVLRLLLAGFFVYLAYQNLSGNPDMISDFRRWGYPDWFRQSTAWLQIGGAMLLVVPATCFWGAGVLGAVLLGAIATHLMHDPWLASGSPTAFLIAVVGTSVWFRPGLFQ
jgi:uncharacterized membrane protein YphA (DoxX/SURF4 family)